MYSLIFFKIKIWYQHLTILENDTNNIIFIDLNWTLKFLKMLGNQICKYNRWLSVQNIIFYQSGFKKKCLFF